MHPQKICPNILQGHFPETFPQNFSREKNSPRETLFLGKCPYGHSRNRRHFRLNKDFLRIQCIFPGKWPKCLLTVTVHGLLVIIFAHIILVYSADISGLLESLSAAVAHPSLPAVEQDISSLVGDDDTEARQIRAVAVTVLAVLDSLGEVSVVSIRFFVVFLFCFRKLC